jgi:hypothetical protein
MKVLAILCALTFTLTVSPVGAGGAPGLEPAGVKDQELIRREQQVLETRKNEVIVKYSGDVKARTMLGQGIIDGLELRTILGDGVEILRFQDEAAARDAVESLRGSTSVEIVESVLGSADDVRECEAFFQEQHPALTADRRNPAHVRAKA